MKAITVNFVQNQAVWRRIHVIHLTEQAMSLSKLKFSLSLIKVQVFWGFLKPTTPKILFKLALHFGLRSSYILCCLNRNN
ncbi:hypothetical protein ACT4WO_20035 (plasmid) [Acinetobacter baumannii]